MYKEFEKIYALEYDTRQMDFVGVCNEASMLWNSARKTGRFVGTKKRRIFA
jgi:hypothetical protein